MHKHTHTHNIEFCANEARPSDSGLWYLVIVTQPVMEEFLGFSFISKFAGWWMMMMTTITIALIDNDNKWQRYRSNFLRTDVKATHGTNKNHGQVGGMSKLTQLDQIFSGNSVGLFLFPTMKPGLGWFSNMAGSPVFFTWHFWAIHRRNAGTSNFWSWPLLVVMCLYRHHPRRAPFHHNGSVWGGVVFWATIWAGPCWGFNLRVRNLDGGLYWTKM